MKKFLFVFSLLILTMGLTAETIVDYTQVSGNWNELGSPYIVTTNIEIPQNEILTIDAGVTIIMNDDISITAYGVLNANGEVENSINFQGLNESTVWHGIEVNSEGSNFTYTNIIGAKRGLSFYKTNYANYCNLVGYGTDDFEQALFVGKGNQSILTNIDIHGYLTGISIKADDDADDDHEPTTPTMDIIRILYSLDSLKGDRSQPTRGIVIDTKSEPALSNVEIVNYDEAITIKADDDDDDDKKPTTPTMDIIRILYSLDSIKGDRAEPSRGIVVQGRSNVAFTDVEIVNYDEAITIKADDDDDDDKKPTTPTMDIIRILYSLDSIKGDRAEPSRGIVVQGRTNVAFTDVEIENYDEAITIKADDDDDDDKKPTTPTMDIIRILYSLDSIKGDRAEPSRGIVVQGRTNAAFTDVEIENYDEAITIKADDDDDDDKKPTTPTMDIIRILYSLDSIKGDRTAPSKGIVVDGKTSPAFTDVEIVNYDEAITIKADDDDDDDKKPTTPTMDIIRILYSLDSIKGETGTRRASKGLSVEGRVNLVLNNASIENFDIGLDFNSSGSHELNDILLPNDSYSRDNYGVRAKGNNSFNINTINIQNYDNAISSTCYAEETSSVITNAVISQTQRDRSNSKAISFQGTANLFVDNSTITNYDKSIYLKNNYPTPVTGKVEYTEIYQNGERRGSYSGIEFSGKVLAEINNNVIKSCDPAIKIKGNNSQSSIARNLIFITYEKNNSRAVDVKSINQNSMKHNTIVNYAQGLYAKHTPSSVINNIIWNNNPTNDIMSDYDYIEARYNNISLPNGRLFTGNRNLNMNPLFMGERLGFEPDPDKTNFAEKWNGFQLEFNSPCRDGGDPVETPDSDGTVPDLGAFEFVGNKDNSQIAVVSNLSLSSFPNPFNPSTNILFTIAEQGKVDLKVYNIKGQLVKTLLNEERAVGTHNIVWNGDDNRGKGVASGVYFVKIANGKNHATRKILLAK